jgi:chromosome segregation ATPase
LEQKLRELKKELERIYYKESIIVKYVDDTKDKDEIERLIAEIEELTKALEKIKKEIKSQEKNITDDTILLDNGNVVITNINRDFIGDDKEKINEYISTYKNTLDKIESIEKETETLSENADSKKDEINLSEEAYERDVNLLYDVEKTSDFIKKYIEDARTNLNNVKREVETSVDRLSRFRAVRRGISNQTRLLSAMLTINSLRRNRNRRINFALGVATGVSFIRDVFSYDFVEEYYNEITKKETLVGLENVDTNSARYLINDAKKQLDTLLEDCEKTYSDYPDFDDLKSQIIDLKNDIEKEEKELKEMEDKLQQYKGEERVKILKYKDE